MMRILAPVDHIRFDIEEALENQTYAVFLPFTGVDSKFNIQDIFFPNKLILNRSLTTLKESGQAVCEQFLRGACDRGGLCPYRHVRGN